MRVIDLGAGYGEPSLRAARRVGSSGSVVGVDLSEPVLALAREKAGLQKLSNIEYRAIDAETLAGIPDGSFDVALARWSFSYMREPVSALKSARRVLKPGGVLVAAFWAEEERVSWVRLPRRVLANYHPIPSADLPGALRHRAVARIDQDLAQSGFVVKSVEETADIAVVEAKEALVIVDWMVELGFTKRVPDGKEAAAAADLVREVERVRVGDVIRLGGVSRLVVGVSR
jgi:SAM-dependent methyltransferase